LPAQRQFARAAPRFAQLRMFASRSLPNVGLWRLSLVRMRRGDRGYGGFPEGQVKPLRHLASEASQARRFSSVRRRRTGFTLDRKLGCCFCHDGFPETMASGAEKPHCSRRSIKARHLARGQPDRCVTRARVSVSNFERSQKAKGWSDSRSGHAVMGESAPVPCRPEAGFSGPCERSQRIENDRDIDALLEKSPSHRRD